MSGHIFLILETIKGGVGMGVGGQNDKLVLFGADFNAESFAFYRIKKFQLLFELLYETRDKK